MKSGKGRCKMHALRSHLHPSKNSILLDSDNW